MRQQIGEAAGAGIVVAAQLIGEQEAGGLRADAAGVEAELRVQQDSAGVWGERLADRDLELAHHLRSNILRIDAASDGQRLLQAPSLIHGGRSDHSALVRKRFQMRQFTGGKFHGLLSHAWYSSWVMAHWTTADRFRRSSSAAFRGSRQQRKPVRKCVR